ncbi:hypothetical protein BGAL_0034g00350 [Botrytis galanthina]|uniref:Uncharacterized protein n=1 Tax=Botrytis galanthina TaxID=278940 RepID=A0A4S8RKC7_9HELO|nr:hypothetical protein BGAL_0034g00350 [Botrytis galanthina]
MTSTPYESASSGEKQQTQRQYDICIAKSSSKAYDAESTPRTSIQKEDGYTDSGRFLDRSVNLQFIR